MKLICQILPYKTICPSMLIVRLYPAAGGLNDELTVIYVLSKIETRYVIN